MDEIDVMSSQVQVLISRLYGDPLPGWVAEVAKIDERNIPECSLQEFRDSLPETVPEFATVEPLKPISRWRFWRYW